MTTLVTMAPARGNMMATMVTDVLFIPVLHKSKPHEQIHANLYVSEFFLLLNIYSKYR